MSEPEQKATAAILERLERIVENLSTNSITMGKLLAVHDEKITHQDTIDGILFEKIDNLTAKMDKSHAEIKTGCERDIRKVDERLRLIEKKMWSIFGALAVISFLVSVPGQKVMQNISSPDASTASLTSGK